MLKIDPKAISTNSLYRNVDIFPVKYTQWFRFLALEIKKKKQEQNPSLLKAAQFKSLSVECHIWNHPYWLCLVFKSVTVNNCALCGTHQMALIGASRELALQFWHQNRTQPHMEHSICQNYLQRLEISAVCMFQRCLMEEVISCAICNNVGKLQRPFLDHARHENATLQAGEEKFNKLLNYNYISALFPTVWGFLFALTDRY